MWDQILPDSDEKTDGELPMPRSLLTCVCSDLAGADAPEPTPSERARNTSKKRHLLQRKRGSVLSIDFDFDGRLFVAEFDRGRAAKLSPKVAVGRHVVVTGLNAIDSGLQVRHLEPSLFI